MLNMLAKIIPTLERWSFALTNLKVLSSKSLNLVKIMAFESTKVLRTLCLRIHLKAWEVAETTKGEFVCNQFSYDLSECFAHYP